MNSLLMNLPLGDAQTQVSCTYQLPLQFLDSIIERVVDDISLSQAVDTIRDGKFPYLVHFPLRD